MQAVFVCGGRGTRLRPRRAGPKTLVSVGRSTLLSRLVHFARPLQCSEASPIVIVDANDRETPEAVASLLPSARVLRQPHPDGVANALLLAHPFLAEPAIVFLGDVFVDGTLPRLSGAPALTFWHNAPPVETQKNFGIAVDRAGIAAEVIEKPAACRALECGMGVYVLTPDIVSRFRDAPIDAVTGERGITRAIQTAIDAGVRFRTLAFRGYYNNVNSPADVIAAEQYLAQSEGVGHATAAGR